MKPIIEKTYEHKYPPDNNLQRKFKVFKNIKSFVSHKTI